MLDLLIKNCRVVEADGVYENDLWIKDGKIVGRVDRGMHAESKEVIDAEGRYVLPGAIDTHSHIGQLPGPGYPKLQTFEENYETESASAVFGGTTTAVNFIFTQESVADALPYHRKTALEHSNVDIVFHGALMNDLHIQEIEKCVKLGVNSFKIFLPYKGDEAVRLGGLSSLNDGQLIEALTKLAALGALPVVHSENPEMIDYFMNKYHDPSRQDMAAWEMTRPGIVEAEAAAKVIYLAQKTNSRLCIAHVSSADTVDEIEKAGGTVILETCPHYLTLTAEAGLGSLGKVSPPVRYARDRERLWEAIEKGMPVVIGSDHNAWVKEFKSELWYGLAGLPGNAYILSALLSGGVYERQLPITDIVKATSWQAAKLHNLYPRKGTLKVGSDADFAVMDDGISKKVDPSELPSIVDYSPYQDYTFRFWPNTVVKGGKIVAREGVLVKKQ